MTKGFGRGFRSRLSGNGGGRGNSLSDSKKIQYGRIC